MSGPAAVIRLEFRTQRLAVGALNPGIGEGIGSLADLDAIAAILAPAVLEHLPEPLQMPAGPNPIESWVAARLTESALYSVFEVSTETVVGLMILAQTAEPGDTPTLRLGYLFAKSVWGRGYGTELVAGVLQVLEDAGWKGQILAGVSTGNPGSSRILLKTGFIEVPTGEAHSRTYRYTLT
ncbi:GNAT family N-acetyltransferase [uncultured Hoeflea sp.]|uniref:GNAT family N-acetyltransferase n=1 Tax=uncultured Hoeflea sp. TaxID=538666 RepID=UPI002615DE72|nr:GNAT family N-acetyltransferase [uncultured Hoeflea sp.]